MPMPRKKPAGWKREPARHGLSSRGIPSKSLIIDAARSEAVNEGDRAVLRKWMQENIHPGMDVVWETRDEYGRPLAEGGGFLKLKFPEELKRDKKLKYLVKELFGVFPDHIPPGFTSKRSIERKLRQYEEDIADIRREAEEL